MRVGERKNEELYTQYTNIEYILHTYGNIVAH